jgi:hypothetical protein
MNLNTGEVEPATTPARAPQYMRTPPTTTPSLQERDLETASGVFLQPPKPLPEWTEDGCYMSKSRAAACDMRSCMESRMPSPNTTCCVCSRLLPVLTVKYTPSPPSPLKMPVGMIPNLHFLAKSPTLAVQQQFPPDRFPRHGITTYTHEDAVYCLDPLGISTGVYELHLAAAVLRIQTSAFHVYVSSHKLHYKQRSMQ